MNREQITNALLWKQYFDFNIILKKDSKRIIELIFKTDLNGIRNNNSESDIAKQESQKQIENYNTLFSKYLSCTITLGFDDVEKIKQQ